MRRNPHKNFPSAEEFTRLSSYVITLLAFASAGAYLLKLGYLAGQGKGFVFPLGVEGYPYGGLYALACILFAIRARGISRASGKANK